MIENHLSWFGHVKRKEVTIVSVIRLNNMIFSLKKKKRDQKRHWKKLSREILDLIIFLKF